MGWCACLRYVVDARVGLDVGGAVPETSRALIVLDDHHGDRTLQVRFSHLSFNVKHNTPDPLGELSTHGAFMREVHDVMPMGYSIGFDINLSATIA